MSASDKKKLRKEEKNAMLTQKQQQEKKEARKLTCYTFGFIALMVIVIAVALVSFACRQYEQQGIAEKSTIAAVIDGTELNSVQMNYYYRDAINQMYNNAYSSMGEQYAELFLEASGLDLGAPLNEQEHPEGGTWADYFVNTALENAKIDFAFYNEAMKNDFKLSDEEQESLELQFESLEANALASGYGSADKYLQLGYGYGYGATMASYREYIERSVIATAYATYYQENEITVDAEAIRNAEKGHEDDYNSYDYTLAYLSYKDFIEGGTEGEDGTMTYTPEEEDAARAKAKEAADKLATATSVEEMETILEEIEVNETSGLAINAETNVLHSVVKTADLAAWLADPARTEGEIGIVANKQADNEEIINGYDVVCFLAKYDNKEPMSNVRHLLVAFEGGSYDDATGETIYTDEEKAAAKEEADKLLKEWESGEKTEARFIEMLKEHSDDNPELNDGLYENINPHSEYVPSFLEWSINPERKTGDYGLVETMYGWHLMYYVGDTEMTYRDYMISEELKASTADAWYNSVLSAVNAETKDLSKLELDMVLSPGHTHDHEEEEASEDKE